MGNLTSCRQLPTEIETETEPSMKASLAVDSDDKSWSIPPQFSTYDREIKERVVIKTILTYCDEIVMKSQSYQQLNTAIIDILSHSFKGWLHMGNYDCILEYYHILQLVSDISMGNRLNSVEQSMELRSIIISISQLCVESNLDAYQLIEIWNQITNEWFGNELDSGIQYCLDLSAIYIINIVATHMRDNVVKSDTPESVPNLCLESHTTDENQCSEDMDCLLSLSFRKSTKLCAAHKYGVKYLTHYLKHELISEDIIYFIVNRRRYLYSATNVSFIALGNMFTSQCLDTLIDYYIISINTANNIRFDWNGMKDTNLSKHNFHNVFDPLYGHIFDWIDDNFLSLFVNEVTNHIPFADIATAKAKANQKSKRNAYNTNREDSIQLF